jgi:hypothetical protein
LLVRKPDGSILYRLSQQYDLEFSRKPTAEQQQAGFSFYRRVPLEPGLYSLVAAVSDRRTDSASVGQTEFHVPPTEPPDLALSSITLGRESAQSSGHPSENPFQLDDPLRMDGSGILPNLSGVFSKSSVKEILVFFTARTSTAPQPLQCTFEFFRDGRPDFKLEQTLSDMDGAGTFQCVKRIGLDQRKPGSYELRLRVENASRSASRIAKFRVDR